MRTTNTQPMRSKIFKSALATSALALMMFPAHASAAEKPYRGDAFAAQHNQNIKDRRQNRDRARADSRDRRGDRADRRDRREDRSDRRDRREDRSDRRDRRDDRSDRRDRRNDRTTHRNHRDHRTNTRNRHRDTRNTRDRNRSTYRLNTYSLNNNRYRPSTRNYSRRVTDRRRHGYSTRHRGYQSNYRSRLGINFFFGTPGYSRYRWASSPYAFYRPSYTSYSAYRTRTSCERILVEANYRGHIELISVKECYNPWDGYYIIEGSERFVGNEYDRGRSYY